MKSKLSVGVLAVSPAIALSVTYNPMATLPSIPGAVLFDDFDSVQDTTIGTITGGRPQDQNHGTAPLRPQSLFRATQKTTSATNATSTKLRECKSIISRRRNMSATTHWICSLSSPLDLLGKFITT
jgi:hypothetical protein